VHILNDYRSLVIDEEIENRPNGIRSVPTAYFYCARDSAEPLRADPGEILRCIAKQLSSVSVELPIREPARMKYNEVREKGFGCRKLSLEESAQLILSLTGKNPATIVIDTLDECDPSRRYELIVSLEEILHRSANVKIFVTSRDDSDIVCHLSNSPNLYIHAQDNREDIDRFIDLEVERAIDKKRLLGGQVSSNVKGLIVETLKRGAHGM
jgi:hypothetical protein